jgi:hypothetical protein
MPQALGSAAKRAYPARSSSSTRLADTLGQPGSNGSGARADLEGASPARKPGVVEKSLGWRVEDLLDATKSLELSRAVDIRESVAAGGHENRSSAGVCR